MMKVEIFDTDNSSANHIKKDVGERNCNVMKLRDGSNLVRTILYYKHPRLIFH